MVLSTCLKSFLLFVFHLTLRSVNRVASTKSSTLSYGSQLAILTRETHEGLRFWIQSFFIIMALKVVNSPEENN